MYSYIQSSEFRFMPLTSGLRMPPGRQRSEWGGLTQNCLEGVAHVHRHVYLDLPHHTTRLLEIQRYSTTKLMQQETMLYVLALKYST